MSDTKPKRGARETARSEAVAEEVLAAATAPVIAQDIIPQPEPVSAIALARAVPIGPTCPVPAPEGAPRDESSEAAAEPAWTAFAEAQEALVRGFEKAAVEVTSVSRSGMAATADAAIALLGARTFAEAVEINAGLVRRGLDAMVAASVRLSEIGIEAVAEASRPMLVRFGESWGAFRPS